MEQLSVTVDTFNYTFSSANAAPTAITFTPETGLNTDHTGSVGTLATTDADVGDSHTYTLTTTGGAAHATLEIKNVNEVHVQSGVTLTAETPYTFKITTNDGNGGTYSDDKFSVTFSAVGGGGGGEVTQTITLNAGWNLISLQVTPSDTSFRSLFAAIGIQTNEIGGPGGDVIAISQFISGAYKSFDPSAPDMFADGFTSFIMTNASWVRMTDTASNLEFTISGQQYTGPVNIDAGWNLINYYPSNSLLFRSSLASIGIQTNEIGGPGGDVIAISQFISGAYKSFDPSAPDMFADGFTSFTTGAGAWIRMVDDFDSTTLSF